MDQIALPTKPVRARRLQLWTLLFVSAIACGLGVSLYQRFLAQPAQLWSSTIHDRNAHYCFGLNLALDVIEGDFGELLHDFNSAHTWGPLHGLVLSIVLLVGKLDYRLAVLPSLIGWIFSVVLSFLLARRLVRTGGHFAGLLAATFFLVSSAHRAFATDIMLESLGACLTLLSLYTYVLMVQDKTSWSARGFAVALTALFFLKYNYWFLVLVPVVLHQALLRRRDVLAFLRGTSWVDVFRRELRHPLNWTVLLVSVAGTIVFVTGGKVFFVAGKKLSLRNPHNLYHVAYVLLFLRGLYWWRRSGREKVKQLNPEDRQLVFWHGWPVAIWFLLPKRVGFFIWYFSFANRGERASEGIWGGAKFYWGSIVADYHFALWSLGLVLGLILVAAILHRKLRPGALVLLGLLVLATVLTINHPNRKSRFLHSWLPVAWVVAAVGAAQLSTTLLQRARMIRWRPWLSGAFITGLTLAHIPALRKPSFAPEGGPHPLRPSVLQLTDHYLPHLKGCKRVAIVSNVNCKFLTEWTFQERFGGPKAVTAELKGYDPARAQQPTELTNWLRGLKQEAIVILHVPKESPYYEPALAPINYCELMPFLPSQNVFRLVHSKSINSQGCEVQVWRRVNNLSTVGLQ